MEAIPRECIACDGGCGTPAPSKRCSRCHLVYYCSRDCQKKDWSQHKAVCIDVNEMRRAVSEGVGDTFPPTQATNQNCAICLQDTMDDPIILDCRHAFCFACLVDYQAMVRRTSTATEMLCPLCREPNLEGAEYRRITLFMARVAYKGITDEERDTLLSQAQDDSSRILEADPNDIKAMLTKVQLLLLQKDVDQALKILRKLMDKDKENKEKTKKITERIEMALEEGREEDAGRILDENQQFFQQGHCISCFSMQVLLLMAEAQGLAQDWEAALETYKIIMNEDFSPTPVQRRKNLMGLSRCFYEVGHYKAAIISGEGAIRTERHFPGIHKYVALSYKEMGDRQMAKTVMNRAVLYETPWDDQNRQDAYDLFKDIASDDS